LREGRQKSEDRPTLELYAFEEDEDMGCSAAFHPIEREVEVDLRQQIQD
jgi:hypothetical protein